VFAPPSSEIDIRAARQLEAINRLESIDRLVRPTLESEARITDPAVPPKRIMVDRDGAPMLVTVRRLSAQPDGLPPAWLGLALESTDLAGPLLTRVLAGVELGGDVLVTLVDQQGRDLRTSQPSASPLASAELGLSAGWRIAILDSRGRTLQQLGARERWTYGFLISGLVIALLVGLTIAARAWAREAELSRLRADFVSNVSHELKTPLALIRMFGETLESGLVTDPARQHEFHGIIRRESERLTHLINNVLDIAKIDAGTKRFVLARSDLRALVVETLDAYAPLLKQLGFTVSADIPDSPVSIDMDRNAIAQAVVNLFQNAIKYSRETRSIAVALTSGPDDVRLSVTDRGVGIAASEIPRIFETYYRVATTENDGTAGSGLGLAIVQHAMTGHGGRVEVESTPGRGSTFTLSFPRASAAHTGAASDIIADARVSDMAAH
jgi:signal transduction histidine kinase